MDYRRKILEAQLLLEDVVEEAREARDYSAAWSADEAVGWCGYGLVTSHVDTGLPAAAEASSDAVGVRGRVDGDEG